MVASRASASRRVELMGAVLPRPTDSGPIRGALRCCVGPSGPARLDRKAALVSAIDGDDVTVFDREGIEVRAARALAAAVGEVEVVEIESSRGPQRQLVADGEVLGTFPPPLPGVAAGDESAIPLAPIAGERWEETDQGWYLTVVEHGHWVYVFEADLDSLLALDGANTCQRSGRHGDVRVEHVEAVWHCVPVERYRAVWLGS